VPDRFARSHALGNDYVVLEPDDLSFSITPEAVRLLCDRHVGIGSDGILTLERSSRADFLLRVYNPDGSEAEKSGNGLRIAAKFVREHGRTHADRFALETKGGIATCDLRVESGRVVEVSVDMGRASFWSADVPVGGPPREVVAEPLRIGDTTFAITAVTVGNPHCVILVDDVRSFDLATIGPILEHHVLFPARTNVQVASVVSPTHVRARIWERGAGETLASGSSASAVAAACFKRGLTGPTVVVDMPGGELRVSVDPRFGIRQTGPASAICTGDLASDLLERLALRQGAVEFRR